MTARKQIATLVVLLTSLVLLGAPVAADNPNTTTMDVPVDSTGSDPCSGEDVRVTGTEEVSATVTITGTMAHLVGHTYGHLVGTGLTSGAGYIANVRADVTSNIDIDPVTNTGEATIIASGLLIGQGSIPNQVIETHTHATIDANGNVTAAVINVRMACQ
jgi:hypothetical protein